ncbi:Uncharacterized protein BM_BM8490 [Brugia malayi]|uniref:Bm8490 n=1 Tax=Brugia malayi TaxID=6279 RepID=A0A0K0JW17_BRUMA|nr:Uncharacterized protein BM_BM8490 [Brugia malayi]CRZ22371.1 Bm8490 [Brugia malayi]VIO87635.1 Uncharacterized protein BM_BM8490 [Brugia malayi]
MIFLSTICFYPILMITIILIDTNNGLSVPAGLRPAKKVGDPKEQIVPGKQQQQQEQEQQQQYDDKLNIPTPKLPPNLTIRSRMMAALSALSPDEDSKENSSKIETDTSSKPPIIFPKGHKKVPGKATSLGSSKGNVRVIVAPPATLGKNNYGLNTVLQTNLVDSRGRIMKNVSSVPIKVPSSAEMKNAKTRHTARQVESDADKVVPIKFGSTSRRR